jgi:tRNA1Val (adenine37-N6)-methyltransferase
MKVTTDACLLGAWVAKDTGNDSSIKSILDIGSGTGLLSLMLAQHSSAAIDGIELQENDSLQSIENIKASLWSSRIKIYNADAIAFKYDKKYDIIISNPPFYENDLKSQHQHKNIAHHDAGLTLENLLQIIYQQLQHNGKFYLLLPAKREAELLWLIQKEGLFINKIISVHQTEIHSTFRIIVKGTKKKEPLSRSSITIKENGFYTKEFTAFLQPFYLHL